ncbi:MAG: hypothetical protein LUC31_03390 [Coprobacillus sp.]|nr:hypothetical protein [Coprobacillus sp.]
MSKNKEKKVVYYSDPIHDDFDKKGDSRVPKQFKDTYNYIRGHLFRFFSWLFCFGLAVPVACPLAFFAHGLRIKNKEVLKSVKHQGYFLYANHISEWDPIHHIVCVNPYKRSIIIGSHESWGINPFVSGVISLGGGLPTPGDKVMYANYLKGLEWYFNHRRKIILYPEKHIWPYYNDIREFTNDTFRYPVNFNAPSIAATTVLKERKHRKTPKMIIYLDGPFYPDTTLKSVEATRKLRDEVYNAMKKRVTEEDSYEWIKYVYKPREESEKTSNEVELEGEETPIEAESEKEKETGQE